MHRQCRIQCPIIRKFNECLVFVHRISLRNDSEGTMRLDSQYNYVLDMLTKCRDICLMRKTPLVTKMLLTHRAVPHSHSETTRGTFPRSSGPKPYSLSHSTPASSSGPADRNPTHPHTQPPHPPQVQRTETLLTLTLNPRILLRSSGPPPYSPSL